MPQDRLFIYRRAPSAGSVVLANVLNTRHPGGRFPFAHHFQRQPRNSRPEYRVIYWGDTPDWARQVPGLNNVPVPSKKREVEILTAAGVATVTVAANRGEGEWLYREQNHHGGTDLLAHEQGHELHGPHYWVKKEEIAKEFRIHVWHQDTDYISIRTGRKAPMEGAAAHGWIRSRNAGWHIVYDGHGVTDAHRTPAKEAVKALGLDFAAVDIAERPDGSVFVLEVNRAPGLEEVTAAKYAEKIEAWMAIR